MMKNCRKIILFYLCFALLVLSACVSEKNTEEDNRQLETIATQAANWLTTQVPECDVITTQAGKDGIILLTGVKNPGIATYAVLKAFVLEQDGGTFFIKETYDGEASISNGFTAYGFCTEDHTVIFGDTMDSAYDYLNEQRIGVKFEKIRVYLENDTFEDFAIESSSPYLIILGKDPSVTDIEFCSAEFVARYSMYYSEALIRTTSNWINDSSDIPEESLEPNETTVNGEDPNGEDPIQVKPLQYTGDGFHLQIPISGWNYSLYEVAGSNVYCWESEKGTGSLLKVDFFQSGIDVVLEDCRLQGYAIDGNMATRTDSNNSTVTAFFYELPSSGCWRVVSYDVGKSAEESEALSAMASSFELS